MINLGDEDALGSQELSGELNGVDDERVLRHGLLRPRATDIRRPVVEDDVEGGATVVVHELLDARFTLRPGDILLDGERAADWGNGREVDAEDEVADGDALDGDLHPAAGGGAEVEDGGGGFEEAELGVELDELP